jgi:thiamine kinase
MAPRSALDGDRRGMTPGDIAALYGGVIPGSGPLHIEPLRCGLVNETYRVTRDGCAYALRAAGERTRDLGQDREWEARLLKSAADLGVAPRLVYSNSAAGVLITRWVDGSVWSPSDTRAASGISKVAALLRSVHALEAPAPPRVMTPMQWVEYYREALSAQAEVPQAGDVGAGDLGKAARRCMAELERLGSPPPVVCHSDLHILNLLQGEASLVLLDWEYAHVSDPFWDLAGWSANNDFGEEIQLDLLRAYLEDAPSEVQWMRYKLMLWLYDYVCLLWSRLYLSVRQVCGDGIAERARQLDARLRVAAH